MARKKAFNVEKTLHKAMLLFWRNGYSHTSISDLVTAMGIQRGSLYDTYGSKNELFRRSLDYYIEKNWGELQQGIAGKSPIEAIEMMFTQLVGKSTSETSGNGCFVVNSIVEIEALDEDSKTGAQQCLSRIGVFFEKRLKQAKFQGLIGQNADIETLARLLQSSYVGMRIMARVGVSDSEVDNVVKRILSQEA